MTDHMNAKDADVFKKDTEPRNSNDKETFTSFEGPAFYSDRIVIGAKGNNVRITFLEEVPNTSEARFRCATIMPIEGLMNLQQLCGKLLNQHFQAMKENAQRQAAAQQKSAQDALDSETEE